MKYLNTSYESPCPVCANKNNKLLYRVSANEAAKHFMVTQGLGPGSLSAIENKIETLWQINEAAVVACEKCGFVFAEPFISGDHEFYNMLPHTSAGGAENWKWEFDITYKEIEALVASNTDLKLLEIGSGSGDFIRRACTVIRKENILCLEYDASCVDAIIRTGITAHPWHFRELADMPGYEGQFDIICLFQVLEHLDELDETFKALKKLGKPGGHIFIGVPNGRKIRFNERNDALLDMPPNHIGRFNKKSFKQIGKKYQLKIDRMAVEPFTSLDVMKTVMFYQSLKRAQFPPEPDTRSYRIKQYLAIKRMRLQSLLLHKHLGDALWVHYRQAG